MTRSLAFLLAAQAACAFAAGPTAAEMARSIRAAGLDPEQCYRVRDLTFNKEDIRLYLTDGYLIFSKPVAGRRLSAIFSADVEGGDGEVLLLPPNAGERQSMAAFTQSPNLDEHIRAALMLFTDGSAEALLDRINKEGAGRKAPEMGPLLVEKWNAAASNVTGGFELRLVNDLLRLTPASTQGAPSAGSGPAPSALVFLAFIGNKLGNFDILHDATGRNQIVAGRMADHDGRPAYDIWTSFASRATRTGRSKPQPPDFTIDAFRIEAALDPSLRMKATTHVSLHAGPAPTRVFPFAISRAMTVTAARIDGVPAEIFTRESPRTRALSDREDDTFLVVAPDALAAGSEHEFEFDHNGAVITSAGDVYFVGARATWYPHNNVGFATYDLTFRYPKRLTLVTAGDVVEDRIDGDIRITQRRSTVPIRFAGFNLGDYEKASNVTAGLTVEVYANKSLEPALQPRRDEVMFPAPVIRQRQVRPGFSPPALPPMPPPPAPPPPSPLARLQVMAADISASFEFFTGLFGPPALKTLTVAPIPGAFGQGFPGLVYLSTLSYLDPSQRPVTERGRRDDVFFSDLIAAHEVAHQWWGNIVTTNTDEDAWLPEALANYSALLWLEKKKGSKAVESVLADYREHLLKDDGKGHTIEAVGPIVWGQRLNMTSVEDAWTAITYEKGAWIFHMLRRRLGDERFLKLLAELRRRYEFRSVTTEDFRALAKQFLPPQTTSETIDAFFDNWMYSTGIPGIKVAYTTKGVAPAMTVSGSVIQDGVSDDFSVDVPLEIQFAKGVSQTVWVRTSDEEVPFSAAVRQAPLRVVPAPSGILAVKK